MCGIAGFWDCGHKESAAALPRIAAAMAKTLQHRGPDDSGVWSDPEQGIAFGHQRLSIIDRSSTGHQPMTSANGRFVIVYNGEIYNFQELRADLDAQDCRFAGRSDTEVLLEACATWGVEATVTRLVGMFAFAVWDRSERVLTLVRDRIGIKPLYWGRFGRLVLFGSELRALRQHPGWQPRVNRNALAAYTRYLRTPTPYSIYDDVFALPPGHLLHLRADPMAEPKRYWDLSAIAVQGAANPDPPSDQEAVSELQRLLTDSVRRRMLADVPVGAFLSGGIDSSTVVALMQSVQSRPVKTFSVGMLDADFDEAPFARQVADHLATDHTEFYLGPQEALDAIERLPGIFDEPFADSSQIPTYLVSALTRQQVTVALSGDGGDEQFGGYRHYRQLQRKWHILDRVPRWLRNSLARALDGTAGAGLLSRIAAFSGMSRPRQRLNYMCEYLKAVDAHDYYRTHCSQWFEPASLVPGGDEQVVYEGAYDGIAALPNFRDRLQLLDTLTYLPDDILAKVDRCSMATSLEVRVPLLDHRVVEFAWSLPQHFKTRDGQSKWLLRKLLHRYVPAHLFERRKQGLSVPIGRWLRGELRPWAEDLLSEDRLRRQGYFDPWLVHQIWQQHLSGAFDRNGVLWAILMFQQWLDHWKPTDGIAETR